MSGKPRLLDTFCKAGGCSVGYARAGFEVEGVDVEPQPRYPYRFHQADALEFIREHGHEYDVIHASPPCQKYSQVNRLQHLRHKKYPDLLGKTRDLLCSIGIPWILENVEAAPMSCAVRLCGSSFGLLVRRHRLFETSFLLLAPPCSHAWQDRLGARFPTAFRSRKYLDAKGRKQKRLSTVVQVYGNTAGKKLWPEAMGINWMTSKEMTQAIPPAYTEFIGRQLLNFVQ